MNLPENLKYAKTHEWIAFDGDTAKIGLTDYAQKAMGALVFVGLPEVGDEISVGESFADVESVKAVSDVNAPVSASITAINEDVMDAPEKINEDPYGSWLIEVADISEQEELMDAAEYAVFCEQEG